MFVKIISRHFVFNQEKYQVCKFRIYRHFVKSVNGSNFPVTSCIYVLGFEELVSQNTDFGICIFCPSAVFILVLGLSHGGNGLL